MTSSKGYELHLGHYITLKVIVLILSPFEYESTPVIACCDRSVIFIDKEASIFSDGTGNETCKKLNLLAGEHPFRAVIFQASPDSKFNASYRY